MRVKQNKVVQAIYCKGHEIIKLFKGSLLLWTSVPSEDPKYLEVDPNFIYLMPSNNFTDDVNVLSNVVWNAN